MTASPTEKELLASTPDERTEPGPFSQIVDREWLDLCEKSDRTSGHPDMCLITRVELAGAMSEGFFAGTDAARTPPSSDRDLAGAWRPISEAPLTGVRIVATNPQWSEDRRVRVVWWVHDGPGRDEGQYWQDDADSEPDPALWQPLPALYGPKTQSQRRCPVCLGSGRQVTSNEPCATCDGDGQYPEPKESDRAG